MQNIQSLLAETSSASQIAKPPGTPLSTMKREEKKQLQQLLIQMSAAFPHQEASPDTAKIWRLAFEDLSREFGLKGLETALRSFLSRQKFFPHPSEVRQELEAMQKKQQQHVEHQLPPIGCDTCMPSIMPGYVIGQDEMGNREWSPCACRMARLRARMLQELPRHDGKAEAAGGAR